MKGEFAKLFGSGRDQTLFLLDVSCKDGPEIQFWFDPRVSTLTFTRIAFKYKTEARKFLDGLTEEKALKMLAQARTALTSFGDANV